MRVIGIAVVLGVLGVLVSPLAALAADDTATQIAQAVSPLPEALRDAATVVTYDAQGNSKVLREGTNPIVCLTNTSTPTAAFSVSCFHKSMRPVRDFQAKLRAEGKDAKAVTAATDEARATGKLPPLTFGTMMYTRSGKSDAEARTLWVMFAPNATADSTGLPTERPANGGPWLMNAGKPGAHVMIPIAASAAATSAR